MDYITARIQIENGNILDTFREWGFLRKISDIRFAPPEKKIETSSYAEEPGEHIYPYTVDDAFDYNIDFIIETYNDDFINLNSKIAKFNSDMREVENGIKRIKTITLYDDYKRNMIVGTPQIIQTTTDKDLYFRRANGSQMDLAVVTLTIHVSDPSKCLFDYPLDPDTYVIACVGGAARSKGHYLSTDKSVTNTLIHQDYINNYMLWKVTRRAGTDIASIYNIGAKAWFNGYTTLTKDMDAVVYIYNSPFKPGFIGFNRDQGVSTNSNFNFINALNTSQGVGYYNLDAGSTFALMKYYEGDTDASIQQRLDNLLATT